jgi:hypothetical protein
MADENSEKAGSQPENTEVKKDEKADPSTAKTDANAEKPSNSETPWHNDPRFKDELKLLKVAKSLVEANGLEDVDELAELVASGKKVHGKEVDLNKIDEILEKAKTLDRYNKHWAQQAELNKRQQETPEQTAERYQRENEELKSKFTAKEQADFQAKEAKNQIAFYESSVQEQLDSIEGLEKEEKDFLAYALGVGNDCNEINITDKKAIRKLVADSGKKFNNLVKAIGDKAIKNYLDGKKGIPNVPSNDGSATTTKADPLKSSKSRLQAFREMAIKSGSS